MSDANDNEESTMPRYSRCREKLYAALYYLAVGEGDVRSRLLRAHGELRQLRAADVPPALRDELAAVVSEMTSRGPRRFADGEPYMSALENTMAHIRNKTGAAYAERICRLVSDFNFSHPGRTAHNGREAEDRSGLLGRDSEVTASRQ